MSWGADEHGKFGFRDVEDWFLSVVLSFPAPWVLAPRKGTHYGTVILDARGKETLSIWCAEGEPSSREKACFGDWSPEAWAEYVCDSHWESAIDLARAERVIYLRNRLTEGWRDDPDDAEELLRMILAYARWEENVFDEVACGGPGRRRLTNPVLT